MLMSVVLACALVPAVPAQAQPTAADAADVSAAETAADGGADGVDGVDGVDGADAPAATVPDVESPLVVADEQTVATVAEAVPPSTAGSYDTAIADANRYQLVIVVRFAGDTTGDGDTGLNAVDPSVLQLTGRRLVERLNGFTDSPFLEPTLYGYVKDVSDGACRLQSIIPQADEDFRIRYLTLPRAREGYAYAVNVVEDALAAFNRAYPDFDGRSLDGDGDGYADNVLIVPEVNGSAPVIDSPLWPHKADYTGSGRIGAEGRAVRVGTYTMVDTSHGVSTGTIVHETIHAFGAKDLYRAGAKTEDAANRPVGVWDIMAEHAGSRLMRPLAITRQDCGWTKLEETGGGSVTLFAPGSGKRQAVKFKTDLNASEYFVAEFRRASDAAGGAAGLDMSVEGLPSTIGGSGLVVYRVNPVMKDAGNGNKGPKDYVYIFRPGETGAPRGDGAGDLRHAQLSVSGRATLGVADMAAGLADGAITYSDGQNSGIVVSVTEQSDDAITFKLEMPDVTAHDLWKSAVDGKGATALTESGFSDTSLVKAADGALYQVCSRLQSGTRGAGATVYRYDGSSWSSLGSLGNGYGSFSGAVYRNELYVAGVRYGAATTIGLWRWSGRAWKEVATVAVAANKPVLGVAGGALYLFADGSGSGAQLYRLTGSSLTPVGRRWGSDTIAGAHLFDVGGQPAVMAGNFNSDRTELWTLANGVWKVARVHSGFAQTVAGYQDGKHSFALTVTQDGALRLIDLAGTSGGGFGEKYSPSPLALPKAYTASLALGGDRLYVALAEAGSQIARVFEASVGNRASWQQVGANVVSPSTAIDVGTIGDAVFVASTATPDDVPMLLQHGSVGPGAIVPAPPLPSEPAKPAPAPTPAPKPTPAPAPKPTPKPAPSTPAPAPSAPTPAPKPPSSAKAKPAPKPRATTFTKVKGGRRAITLRWKKQTKSVTGYQIRYSTSRKFTKKTTRTRWVKSAKKTSLTVKKLKAKKTYMLKFAHIRKSEPSITIRSGRR